MAYGNSVTVNLEFDEALDAYHFTFTTHGRNAWDIVKGYIEVIKAVVPASNREYNPTTRQWTVTKDWYENKIQPIFEANLYTGVKKTHIPKPKSAEEFFYSYSDPIATTAESKESLADKLVRLLDCSTADLADTVKLKRLYRAKALQYHPDRNNGDGTKMSELNSIWSAYNA